MYLQTNNIQWQLSRFLVFVPWKQIKQLQREQRVFLHSPLHIVGVFFQSPAWYSVFSVAEHAIEWEPTICGGLPWKSVAENTTALHGLVHSTRIICVIVLKIKYYLIS